MLQEAPRARDHCAAAAVDGKLYMIGGRRTRVEGGGYKHMEPLIDVFDMKRQQWSTLPRPLPTPRAGIGVSVVGNNIVVVGGESDRHTVAHREVEALNTETGQWATWPSLETPRHGTGVVQFDRALYIASGSEKRSGHPELQSTERIALDSN